jgi:hypothetical protein
VDLPALRDGECAVGEDLRGRRMQGDVARGPRSSLEDRATARGRDDRTSEATAAHPAFRGSARGAAADHLRRTQRTTEVDVKRAILDVLGMMLGLVFIVAITTHRSRTYGVAPRG